MHLHARCAAFLAAAALMLAVRERTLESVIESHAAALALRQLSDPRAAESLRRAEWHKNWVAGPAAPLALIGLAVVLFGDPLVRLLFPNREVGAPPEESVCPPNA